MVLAKSDNAARIEEKVLALIVVLAALGLAILIAVIDSPATEAGSGMCDHGTCLLRVCFEQIWNRWAS